MKYEYAHDLQVKAEEICGLMFPHIKIEFVKCLRSRGTSTNNTLARCHALGKAMQKAMGVKAFYAIEFIAEQFDKLSIDDQEKVIVHELMHIPIAFGGGFKHHNHVTEKNVNKHFKTYKELKRMKDQNASWFKT